MYECLAFSLFLLLSLPGSMAILSLRLARFVSQFCSFSELLNFPKWSLDVYSKTYTNSQYVSYLFLLPSCHCIVRMSTWSEQRIRSQAKGIHIHKTTSFYMFCVVSYVFVRKNVRKKNVFLLCVLSTSCHRIEKRLKTRNWINRS